MSASLLVLAGAGGLAAQESQPSSPFHSGDWEVQSLVGANLALSELSLLKFTSPTSAWFLSGSFNATKPHFSGPGSIVPNPEPGYALQLSVGRRYFRPVTGRAFLFLTPTVGLNAVHNCVAAPQCQSGWNTGLGLDLGGEYLLAPFVGVGIVGGASLFYGHFKVLNGGVTTSTAPLTFNFGTPFGLMAFLHF